MVCIRSRIGRTIAWTRGLRAHQIPSGMPATRQSSAAVPSRATVVMLRSQNPNTPRYASAAAVNTATRAPAILYARSTMTPMTTGHGVPTSSVSMPSSRRRMPLVVPVKRPAHDSVIHWNA